MNIQQYKTIKMQMNSEKEKIMLEISMLLQERRNIEQQKQYEIHVFQSRSRLLEERGGIAAGFLSAATFSPERMKEYDKKIEKIDEFIRRNEYMLEKVKEKERTIDSMFKQHELQRKREAEKREEKELLDLKMCIPNQMIAT